MTDHEQLMARAREAWQASAPSEQEIHRGAERVGRRLVARTKPFVRRPMVVSAGACAAFLAALAYAGSQKWIETAVPKGHGESQSTTAPAQVVDDVGSAIAPPPASGQLSPLSPGAANDGPSVVAAPSAQPLPTSGTRVSPPPSGSSVERKEATTAAKRSAPSWAEVSEALSGGDEEHAQKLLSDLARQGQDADDRAKAKLGLAQLEASHGNCQRARVLALQVAAVQGIELKTVRRALELAAHCTQ